MNGEEAVKVFDLVRKEGNLPARMEELVPLSFIGAAAVKFYQAKVKLMDQLGMTEAQRKATLADGQDAGEMLLNIEARIGELIDDTDVKHVPIGGGGSRSTYPEELAGSKGKTKRKVATAIHREMKKPGGGAVAAVIKEARENDDIPTKTAVLNKIAYERVLHETRHPKRKTLDEAVTKYTNQIIEMNAALSDIVSNWESVDADVKERFVDAVGVFLSYIKKAKDKKEWKLLAKIES